SAQAGFALSLPYLDGRLMLDEAERSGLRIRSLKVFLMSRNAWGEAGLANTGQSEIRSNGANGLEHHSRPKGLPGSLVPRFDHLPHLLKISLGSGEGVLYPAVK